MTFTIVVAFWIASGVGPPDAEPLVVERDLSDVVHVASAGRALFTIQLAHDRELREYTIRDTAFVLGDAVVVIRGAHYLRRGQCVNPGGKQIEIYSRAGEKAVSRDAFHIGAAHGNHFAAPSRRWGVMLQEESGSVYGYLHVRATGELKYVELPELEWGELGQQRFTASGELVLPEMLEHGKRRSLIIAPDGSYRVE